MSDQTLNHCPFCGSKNMNVVREQVEFTTCGFMYEIVCQGCSVTTSRYDTEVEAIEAWNTRAQPSEIRLNDPVNNTYKLNEAAMAFLNAVRAEYNQPPVKAQSGFSIMEWNYGLRGAQAVLGAAGTPKRESCWVPVDDEDVEVAIAEAIAVMEPKTDYCEKGIPILKDLKKYGWHVMQEKKS